MVTPGAGYQLLINDDEELLVSSAGAMGVILLGVLAQVLYAYFGPKEVVGMADIQKRKEAPTALSNLGGPAPAQLVV